MNMQQPNNQPMTQAPAAGDETGYYIPQASAPGNESWVYGDPSHLQDVTVEINGGANPIPAQGMNGGMNSGMNAVPNQGMNAVPIQGMNGGERPGGISSAAAQSERMKNPVNMADTHMPPNSETAYQASLRSLLNRNVGYFVVATFLIGSSQPVTWQGILHSVGNDYLVIFQPDYERYISGDLYSLKFVQFHNVKGVPYCAGFQNWQGQNGM